MSTQQLNLADKTILWVWRGLNLVGWSLGALLVGGVLVFGMESLFVDVIDAMDVFDQWVFSPVGEWLRTVLTLTLVGAAMGAIIGSRVYRWPGSVAGVSSGLFAFVLPGVFFILPISPSAGRAFWPTGIALVAIAVVTSRWVARRHSRG